MIVIDFIILFKDFIIYTFTFIWGLFEIWINTLFFAPFRTIEMLWLLVPIWLAWAFTELFQEKTGTSLGNAISNAVIIVWGSIDCTRQTVDLMVRNIIYDFWDILARFSIIGFIFLYGAAIVYLGWKGNTFIRRIGRIRQITYIFIIFVPVLYHEIALTWDLILAAILFFPLFYFTIEILDIIIPDPKALVIDTNRYSKK